MSEHFTTLRSKGLKTTRAKGTKSLRSYVLSILSFQTIFKSYGKKQNAKENNAEQNSTNQTDFKG